MAISINLMHSPSRNSWMMSKQARSMLLAQNSKRLSHRKPLKSRNYDKDDFFISIYILPQTNKCYAISFNQFNQ